MELLDLAFCAGLGLLALGGLVLAHALTAPPKVRSLDGARYLLAKRHAKTAQRRKP